MNSKTLKAIQVFAKIGKVLSTIVFICCIIGAAGCTIGLVTFASLKAIKIGDVTIHGIIEMSGEVSIGTVYAGMAVGLVFCIGEIVLAKLAQRYFKHELEAGTPFTMSGAKELMRLGICTAAITLGASITASIASSIITSVFENAGAFSFEGGASVGLGLSMVLVSLICRYGAELTEKTAAGSEEPEFIGSPDNGTL